MYISLDKCVISEKSGGRGGGRWQFLTVRSINDCESERTRYPVFDVPACAALTAKDHLSFNLYGNIIFSRPRESVTLLFERSSRGDGEHDRQTPRRRSNISVYAATRFLILNSFTPSLNDCKAGRVVSPDRQCTVICTRGRQIVFIYNAFRTIQKRGRKITNPYVYGKLLIACT